MHASKIYIPATLLAFVLTPDALSGDPRPCDLLEITRFVDANRDFAARPKHLRAHFLLSDFVERGSSLADAEIDFRGMGPRGANGEAGLLIWQRDHSVLWGFDPAQPGAPIVVSYINPFSERGDPNGTIITYVPAQPPPGLPKEAQPVKLGGKIQYAVARFFPGILEGGNVLWTNHRTSPYILTSQKTVDQNRFISKETAGRFVDQVAERVKGSSTLPDRWVGEFFASLRERKVQLAEREQSTDDVRRQLAKTTGVPVDRVIITPWMPGETTGHVDIWLGTLPGNLLVVPYIPERLIGRLGFDHERAFSKGINDWLSERVKELEKLPDIKVIRVPMLPPKNLKKSELSPLGYDGIFLSTANFAVANGKVLVPEHRRWMKELPTEEQLAVRQEITELFKSAGLTTEFIGADQLMDKKGGIHCATADYPDFITAAP